MAPHADPRIQTAIERIDEQLHRRLTVVELAGAVGLSVAHFTRLFRQATGATPGAYVHEQRIRRARILLERTTLSVAEIMAQVGLADRSHFGRDFRATFGWSPRGLRMQLRTPGRDRAAG